MVDLLQIRLELAEYVIYLDQAQFRIRAAFLPHLFDELFRERREVVAQSRREYRKR